MIPSTDQRLRVLRTSFCRSICLTMLCWALFAQIHGRSSLMMCLDPDAVSHELMFFLSDTDTAGEKGMYVCTDSNPNNVITDKASAFGKVLATLTMNQEVTVMDSDELDKNTPFVKVRIETDGKVIEGWVRRSVLCE